MKAIRKARNLAAVSLIGVIVAAAVAWACTPSPQVQLSRVYGPAATEVTVVGSIFPPAPVEIRWGNEFGEVIGNAHGPEFSTAVQIPAGAARGLHYLYYTFPGGLGGAYQGFEGGAFAIFEVTSGGEQPAAMPRAVAADLWAGFSIGSKAAADSAAASPGPVSGRSGLAAGVALFASGLGATLFAAVLLSRRRIPQATRHRRIQP